MISCKRVTTTSRAIIAVLILGGLLLRLAIAPLGAHPGDLPVMTRWAESLGEVGWLSIYAVTDANYPPLGMALIGASRALFGLLAPGQPVAGPLWLVCLKLPAILADTGIATLVALLARGRKRAPWLVASVALNPALIIMSAWWGQLDSVTAALGLAAVAAAISGQSIYAGIALGAGVMVKPQGALVAPAVILALLTALPLSLGGFSRERGPGGEVFVLAAALPLSVAMLPFALAGQAALVLRRAIALIASPNWLTINALNIWYLASGGAGNWAFNAPLTWPDTTPLAARLPARTVGMFVLTAWSVAVLALAWRARNRREAWLLAAALLVLGAFLWPTQSHERYALGAVPLLAGLVAHAPPLPLEG